MSKRFPRQGIGYDVHALVEGRALILGGVTIPFEKGLLGHSDADVVVHAIMDAICGALAMGDIGQWFPDTDPQYRGISSLRLLERIGQAMEERGYVLGNADAVICCQRPKLAPHLPAMRENIARVLKVPVESIGLQATTTERLGLVGREEGLAAYATVLLFPKEDVEAGRF